MKKVSTQKILVVLLLSLLPFGVLAKTGDVTGDGQVDIADVNAVINMMLGKTTQTAAGDVTGDGQVDIADVNRVINIMLGKEVPEDPQYEFMDIAFAGRGEATTVESVTVTNLITGATKTLNGNAILRLVVKDASKASASHAQGIVRSYHERGIAITPAMSYGDAWLSFTSASAGLVKIEVIDDDGVVVSSSMVVAPAGRNTAILPAHPKGDYTVRVTDAAGNVDGVRWHSANKNQSVSVGSATLLNSGSGRNIMNSPLCLASSGNTVTMDFNRGDILRFEGTSGGMRTIMHVSPESSHDVTFDFFRCQDANGYNYPIVRIGDMLWMLEDLRPQTMSGLVKTSNPVIWKSIGDYDAAEFVNGDKAYYTVAGARLAMPEGWETPSIDELHGLVEKLQVDTLQFGDFLKDRDAEWPLTLAEGLDTIHLQLLPHGYVNSEGSVVGNGATGSWVTRTTVDHGCPAAFEIKSASHHFFLTVPHEKRSGFTVRGCRPAPSPFQEMLTEYFHSNQETLSSGSKMPMELVNTNGPLGCYYTYGAERSSIFFDYSGLQYNSSTDEQRSGILYKGNTNAWSFSDKNMIPLNVNGSTNGSSRLRKVTTQGNAAGYENLVYASWSKPFRVFTDGSNQNSVASVVYVMGVGVVKVTIYGDSTLNHAIVGGCESKPLLDANGNEYHWVMPTFNNSKLSRKIYGSNSDLLSDVRREYFARAFNLHCIQDQTGDGIEEIVMNVANKIAVFDGVSLRCIREQEYADRGSYIGTPNLRFDVADVNGDGREDIVMVLNSSGGLCYLKVYSEGHIDEEPIFEQTYGSEALFCDVKVGNMSGSDLPEIAILTRGLDGSSNSVLTKHGFLYVLRLMYDDNLTLKEQSIIDRLQVGCFENGTDENRYVVGNMNLVFGYFRGRNITDDDGNRISYPQDLIVGDGLWRWDDTQGKPTYRFQMLPWAKGGQTVPADAIAAVQTLKNYKESLLFFRSCPWGKNDGRNHTFVGLGEAWLSADGNSRSDRFDFNQAYFGWCNSGASWSSGTKDYELESWMNYSQGQELNNHPVLCKFTDREREKHFRFVSYDVTFSEPRIHAAIAAAPYYAGLQTSASPSTVWGKELSSGSSTSQSDSWGGSVIMGYEHSYSAPFLSSMNAGVEFTLKVSAGATLTTGTETTTSYGTKYTAGQDHVLVMQASPYDTYTYEIIDSDEPDDIGMSFVVSIPRGKRFVDLKLEDYLRLTASQSHVAKPQRFLIATPGVPDSYPANYNGVPYYTGNAFLGQHLPFLEGRDQDGGNSYQFVGTGESVSRSISLATNSSSTTSVEFGVETELVGKLMGIKAGVGFNYNHTNESTHTIGKNLTVEGTVPSLPSYNDPIHPPFSWNIVWFYVKDEGGIYPVVNYEVIR